MISCLRSMPNLPSLPLIHFWGAGAFLRPVASAAGASEALKGISFSIVLLQHHSMLSVCCTAPAILKRCFNRAPSTPVADFAHSPTRTDCGAQNEEFAAKTATWATRWGLARIRPYCLEVLSSVLGALNAHAVEGPPHKEHRDGERNAGYREAQRAAFDLDGQADGQDAKQGGEFDHRVERHR
jgi:hypothetical protein